MGPYSRADRTPDSHPSLRPSLSMTKKYAPRAVVSIQSRHAVVNDTAWGVSVRVNCLVRLIGARSLSSTFAYITPAAAMTREQPTRDGLQDVALSDYRSGRLSANRSSTLLRSIWIHRHSSEGLRSVCNHSRSEVGSSCSRTSLLHVLSC